MSYKSVRFTARGPREIQREVNVQAKELCEDLRLSGTQHLGYLQQLLWWDPHVRQTGNLPHKDKVAASLSYAMTHGCSIREVVQLRKHNFAVPVDGVMCEKPSLGDDPARVTAHLEAVKKAVVREDPQVFR